MFMRKILCLTVSGVGLSERVASAIFDAAQAMIANQDRRTRFNERSNGFDGMVWTRFETSSLWTFEGLLFEAKIESEETGNIENLAEAQLPGQALAVPPVNGLVPPHGPFPTRQPVHRLKIQDGAKSFNVIHGVVVVLGMSIDGFTAGRI